MGVDVGAGVGWIGMWAEEVGEWRGEAMLHACSMHTPQASTQPSLQHLNLNINLVHLRLFCHSPPGLITRPHAHLSLVFTSAVQRAVHGPQLVLLFLGMSLSGLPVRSGCVCPLPEQSPQ